MKNKTLSIVYSATIAALYCALTLAVYPLSYGPLQFRISEALCILPLFMPQSVIGLTVGCFLSNIFSTAGPLDMVFGTLATLIASIVSYIGGRYIKNTPCKLLVGILSPTLFNALIVPFAILAMTDLSQMYFITALWIGVGELAVLTALGIPLYFSFKPIAEKLVKK
ncbi:MAG: QueT transporter family protein [Clostridiales bacterium]|nr:QueT transporter family protein [Clostridiales bacterium]